METTLLNGSRSSVTWPVATGSRFSQSMFWTGVEQTVQSHLCTKTPFVSSWTKSTPQFAHIRWRHGSSLGEKLLAMNREFTLGNTPITRPVYDAFVTIARDLLVRGSSSDTSTLNRWQTFLGRLDIGKPKAQLSLSLKAARYKGNTSFQVVVEWNRARWWLQTSHCSEWLCIHNLDIDETSIVDVPGSRVLFVWHNVLPDFPPRPNVEERWIIWLRSSPDEHFPLKK